MRARSSVVLALGWMSGLLVVLLCVGGGAEPGARKAVISGRVRAAEIDDKGNVLAVEIVVDEDGNEDPYLVVGKGKGMELYLYIGKQVIAGGTVVEDERGWKTIEVEHYAPAEQYPDPSKVVR